MKPKFVITLILILLLGSTEITYACEPYISKHPFKDAKAVFFGEVVEIVKTNDRCSNVVKFRIEQYWKGKLSEHISIVIPTTLCCGYSFQAGERYFIYAGWGENTRFETSPGRILAERFAEEQIKKLGKGKKFESKQQS
jgi:hypothetical protein